MHRVVTAEAGAEDDAAAGDEDADVDIEKSFTKAAATDRCGFFVQNRSRRRFYVLESGVVHDSVQRAGIGFDISRV